jgi:predicted membrane chloride channel (bestrophin family)
MKSRIFDYILMGMVIILGLKLWGEVHVFARSVEREVATLQYEVAKTRQMQKTLKLYLYRWRLEE